MSFGLCCFLPTYPSKAPWYHISVRRATISLSLLFTLRHRFTLCESLSSSSTTAPIGTFTLEQWHAHHTKKSPHFTEVTIPLFTFQPIRDFIPLVKFDGNTEPVMMDIQGSDTNQMAEQKRFELLLGYKPTDGFQDRSLEPLGYCSILFQTIFRKKKSHRLGWPSLL